MDWIKTVFGAVGSVFGWMLQRLSLNNSPEMQKADKARKEAELNNEINNEIQDENDSKSRDRIAP